MKNMKAQMIVKISCLAMMLLGNILTSCTKYDTPLSVEEGDTTGENRLNIKRNVLWVNIEGAGGGDLVKNAFPDDGVVKGLLPHSRYAWSGLELEHADDISYAPTEEHAVACASLLTGNMPGRHGISDNTYISEQYYDPNTLESIKKYPGFFQYIVDYDKSISTLAVTPWENQNKKLLSQATRVITTSTDEETLNTVLTQLNEENYRATYLSFRSVLDAAKQGGWQSSNAGYVNAMHKMDDYIGQLLDAIKARSNYYYEDWLIVITSNHGGKADGTYGGMSLEERNMFGIFYYEHLSHPLEMNPGLIEDEVMRFDKQFQGEVLDSIIRTPDLKNIKTMRQVYSLDSLNGGMTVEYIMAARPAENRSYVTHSHNQTKIMVKGRWSMRIEHERGKGYNASPIGYFFEWGNYSDGTWTQQNAGFLNPMIHTATTTVNVSNSVGYTEDEKVDEKVDQWGNITPAYMKKNYKRKGNIEVYSYYDGIKKLASTRVSSMDRASSEYIDNANLTLKGEMYNTCRYFPEIRIWNRALTEAEVKAYSNKLKLTEADPLYKDLIGYWQFYKDKDGEEKYLKDDSLVVNQIKTVMKRVNRNGVEQIEEIATEPIRLRKPSVQNGKTYYTHIDKEDVSYMTLLNTLSQTVESKGRLMDSSLPVPAILEWIGVTLPLETTSENYAGAFRTSKLDAVSYTWNPLLSRSTWTQTVLGDYTNDLEWRDRE